MNLGLIGKDCLAVEDKDKYNLARFWKEEFLIGIIKVYANLANLNKEDALNNEQVAKDGLALKKIFSKYIL